MPTSQDVSQIRCGGTWKVDATRENKDDLCKVLPIRQMQKKKKNIFFKLKKFNLLRLNDLIKKYCRIMLGNA